MPWLAFPLLGVALAAVDFTRAGRAAAFFFSSFGLALGFEVYAALIEGRADALGAYAPHLMLNWGTNDSPTSIPLMLSAGSTAAAILSGLIWWQLEGPVAGPTPGFFRALGRATLTHYLLHLALAFALLKSFYPEEDWPIALGVLAFVLYVAAAAPLTQVWLRHFRQGPLEALLARLAGPYRS